MFGLVGHQTLLRSGTSALRVQRARAHPNELSACLKIVAAEVTRLKYLPQPPNGLIDLSLVTSAATSSEGFSKHSLRISGGGLQLGLWSGASL
jgi:hypothetical protein